MTERREGWTHRTSPSKSNETCFAANIVTAGGSIQGRFKTLIRLLDLKGQFTRLVFVQFLRGPHLIKSNEPMDNFTPAFEILLRNFVDGLDYLRKQWVQRVL